MKHAIALLALLMAGCDSSPKFSINNPTTNAIHVKIDDKAYDVPPKSSTELSLSQGQHTLDSVTTGNIRFSVCGSSDNEVLINPTLSDFVIVSEIYVSDESQLNHFGSVNRIVTLNNEQWQGPFEQVHKLFIDRKWSFDDKTPFPDSQTVVNNRNKSEGIGKISTKLFTANDFIQYVESETNSVGEFAKTHPEGYMPVQYKIEHAPKELPRLAPEFEVFASQKRSTYQQRLDIKNADDCETVKKADFDATMKFTSETAGSGTRHSLAADKSYDNFLDVETKAIGTVAVILP